MSAVAATPFNRADVMAILPILIVGATVIVAMSALAVRRHHAMVMWITLAGMALAIVSLPLAAAYLPRPVTPLLMMDRYTLFFTGMICLTAIASAAFCYVYFAQRPGMREELYLLLALATLGAVVLVASSHFASFILGLEILSVALFALVPYPAPDQPLRNPLEAGIKYLVLAGATSAVLLFGIALLYMEAGTLEFPRLGVYLLAENHRYNALVLTGVALILVGVGFKLSLVPFHMWTPDVYQGAPAPITGFLATVSKAGVFAVLLRWFIEADLYSYRSVLVALGLIAIASMLVGNLLALLQTSVKRLLAYSSIAHMGYILVALLAGGPLAVEAASYYLVAYTIMTLGAFGIVSVLSSENNDHDRDALADYHGLFWHRPWLAAAFTAMLLSLAGIPLTVGFIGKFYVIAAGVNAALWALVLTLVVGSIIGLYYYLRVVVVMYLTREDAASLTPALDGRSMLGGHLTLAFLTVLLLWLGIFPSSLIELIGKTAVRLV